MATDNKKWSELPVSMSGSSDDKITLVSQWILTGLVTVLPVLAIFSRGRRRRRLLATSFWLMISSTLLALSQEGQLERFKQGWSEGQAKQTKGTTVPPKPPATGAQAWEEYFAEQGIDHA